MLNPDYQDEATDDRDEHPPKPELYLLLTAYHVLKLHCLSLAPAARKAVNLQHKLQYKLFGNKVRQKMFM